MNQVTAIFMLFYTSEIRCEKALDGTSVLMAKDELPIELIRWRSLRRVGVVVLLTFSL